MKIAIWVKQEIVVGNDVLRECHEEARHIFDTDSESLEGLLTSASARGDIDLPDEWRIHEEFDMPPLTLAELEQEIREQI